MTTDPFEYDWDFPPEDLWCVCEDADHSIPAVAVIVERVEDDGYRHTLLAHHTTDGWAYCARNSELERDDQEWELDFDDLPRPTLEETTARDAAGIAWVNTVEDVDWHDEWKTLRREEYDEQDELVEELRYVVNHVNDHKNQAAAEESRDDLREAEERLRELDCQYAIADLDDRALVPAAVALLTGGWHGSADDLIETARTLTSDAG